MGKCRKINFLKLVAWKLENSYLKRKAAVKIRIQLSRIYILSLLKLSFKLTKIWEEQWQSHFFLKSNDSTSQKDMKFLTKNIKTLAGNCLWSQLYLSMVSLLVNCSVL